LSRIDNNEKTVEFVDNIMSVRSNLTNNSSSRQQRARAKMDLAKKCINTAKDKEKPIPKIRARAWEQCRKYPEGAESDLNTALENVSSPIEKDYILQDMTFLKKLKNIAPKPVTEPTSKVGGNRTSRRWERK
jgi:hypothetical protein